MAQAIGRIGNYFNQELFGGPTSLPWALQISPAHRPAGYEAFATFQPTFLYELIWNLGLAAFLVWLGHHRRIRPPGLFALYVTGYSAFRIFEESLRVDPAHHILGLRLNFYVACLLTIAGAVWFRTHGPVRRSKSRSSGEAGRPAVGCGERRRGPGPIGLRHWVWRQALPVKTPAFPRGREKRLRPPWGGGGDSNQKKLDPGVRR